MPEGMRWKINVSREIDDRVPGVGATLIPDDDIGIAGKDVDDLAFAFVPPLRSDDDKISHVVSDAYRWKKIALVLFKDQSCRRIMVGSAYGFVKHRFT